MKVTRHNRLTRRRFIGTTAAAVSMFNIVPRHVLGAPGQPSANDKLNIGCIGVGGMQGLQDTKNAAQGNNIYALCDVDKRHLGTAAAEFPSAKKYEDFREMLDKEHKNLDAITVVTPDHMHATISLWGMERGLGVYCEKPLTQTVWEANLIRKAAQKYKVATQMGNQGYSCEATRLACELIWDGRLGDVTEVHSMQTKNHRGYGINQWPPSQPVPEYLDWDLWLGRAPKIPYYSCLHPVNWRGFPNFGAQAIGNWAVHMLGPAHWGLQLGGPESIECISVEGVNPVSLPLFVCRYDFPERPNKYVPSGKMPPLSLYWYEGDKSKEFKLPEPLTENDWMKGMNTLFVGSKGFMATSGRGESVRLVPEGAMKKFRKPPRVLDRVPAGHMGSWVEAVKGGKPAASNFNVAGRYMEWLLLGTISWRFPNQKLMWDAENLRFTNNDAANEFVKPTFRKGWELEDIVI